MRNIIWFLALIVLLLFQAGVLLPLRIAPINLILVVVAMATLLSEFSQGLVIAFMGGVLLDFVSGTPDGVMSMSIIIVFVVMHLILNQLLSKEPNKFILAASVAGSTIVYFLAHIILSKFFELFSFAPELDLDYLLTVSFPLSLMWNLLFAYFIFRYYYFVQNLASKLPFNEEPIRT